MAKWWRKQTRSGEPHLNQKLACIVNNSLKMGKGKIAAQVGHACIKAYREFSIHHPSEARAWIDGGEKKIILKAPSRTEIEKIAAEARDAGLETYEIKDAGHTQIPPGSLTVLAIGPASEKKIDNICSNLKLL